MRSLFSVTILFALGAFAGHLHAEATAPAAGCVSASIDARPIDGQILYRIVFVNQCDAPRSIFWCVENPSAAVPPPVACPRAETAARYAAEPRYWIAHRKEFQWNLPAGSRIRYRDCAGQEVPTVEFSCAPPPSPGR